MTLVYSKKEIDEIRPYKDYKLKIYPKSYPAYIEFAFHEGGLGGGYYTMKLLEIPKPTSSENPFLSGFCAGVQAEPKTYGEKIFGEKLNETKRRNKKTVKKL